MSNNPRKKRARQLAERKLWQARRQRRALSTYPEFVYDEKEGTPEFVQAVRDVIKSFRFEDLPGPHAKWFRDMAKHGTDFVRRHIQAAQKMLLDKDPSHSSNMNVAAADLQWEFCLGQWIQQKIPIDVRRRLLPVNDAYFHYADNKIIVLFRSLLKVGEGDAAFYYSRNKPTIEVGGTRCIIAFGKHVIDRISDRINDHWIDYYSGLGDVFAYLEQTTYFELCTLRNGYPAFSFFDMCGDERFVQYNYVREVLGMGNLDPALGPPYYRLGYCPADIVDKQFFRARTLLSPGFKQTPEFALIDKSSLSEADKDKLRARACNSEFKALAMNDEYPTIKWFHDNGIPQVIQTKREMHVLPRLPGLRR